MKKRYYALEIEEWMQMFSATLNERDFRRYAAVEALKLEHGGIEYISRLLGIDPKSLFKNYFDLTFRYRFAVSNRLNLLVS